VVAALLVEMKLLQRNKAGLEGRTRVRVNVEKLIILRNVILQRPDVRMCLSRFCELLGRGLGCRPDHD